MKPAEIINSFNKKKILLIGDTILDIYSSGREVCKSSDSNAVEVEEDKISVSFGGASLVASNMLELGAKVVFFSLIGEDEIARHYDNFKHPNLEKHFFSDGRPTTVKKRFWVGNKKLFQANQVDNRYIKPALERKIIKEIERLISGVDVITVLDARHGFLSKELIADLIKLGKKYQKPLYVDSQISHRPSNHHSYKGADCLFLNEKEVKAVNARSLGAANFIVKLGERGSEAWFGGKHIKAAPYPVKAVDPCGAGDAFLAAFSLGDRNAIAESLAIANTWAALSTMILGTVPPRKKDLIKIYEKK